jgi:predicted amidohydrolase
MKAAIIQPPYSRDVSFSDEYFEYKMNLLKNCDESVDIIVLPEYSDVPCAALTREDNIACSEKYRPLLLKKAADR